MRTYVRAEGPRLSPSAATAVAELRAAAGEGQHGKSIAAYREEAKKCVLVCANCHGEIESGLIESPPPGARYCGGSGGEAA
jgi:cytochrome c553